MLCQLGQIYRYTDPPLNPTKSVNCQAVLLKRTHYCMYRQITGKPRKDMYRLYIKAFQSSHALSLTLSAEKGTKFLRTIHTDVISYVYTDVITTINIPVFVEQLQKSPDVTELVYKIAPRDIGYFESKLLRRLYRPCGLWLTTEPISVNQYCTVSVEL